MQILGEVFCCFTYVWGVCVCLSESHRFVALKAAIEFWLFFFSWWGRRKEKPHRREEVSLKVRKRVVWPKKRSVIVYLSKLVKSVLWKLLFFFSFLRFIYLFVFFFWLWLFQLNEFIRFFFSFIFLANFIHESYFCMQWLWFNFSFPPSPPPAFSLLPFALCCDKV